MKKATRLILLAVVTVFACMLMTGCHKVMVSGELTINADGTGNRVIFAEIAKNDEENDGWGTAYGYLTKHGAELEAHIESIMTENVPGSENWLNITVEDGTDVEIVKFSFDFSSIDDYMTKMDALAFDKNGAVANNANAVWVMPSYVEEDGVANYRENKGCMTAIANSILCVLMDDGTYDDTCGGRRTEVGAEGFMPEDMCLTDGQPENKISGSYPLVVKFFGGEAINVDINFTDGDPDKYFMVVSSEPAGTGNEDTGNAGTGNAGTGNEDTGNAGTGNEDTGNAGTGNEDTGNAGTGNAPTTGEGLFAGVIVAVMCACAFVALVTFKKAKN